MNFTTRRRAILYIRAAFAAGQAPDLEDLGRKFPRYNEETLATIRAEAVASGALVPGNPELGRLVMPKPAQLVIIRDNAAGNRRIARRIKAARRLRQALIRKAAAQVEQRRAAVRARRERLLLWEGV